MVVNFLTRALSEPINQLEKSDWMCKVFVRDFYVRSHWLFIGKFRANSQNPTQLAHQNP